MCRCVRREPRIKLIAAMDRAPDEVGTYCAVDCIQVIECYQQQDAERLEIILRSLCDGFIFEQDESIVATLAEILVDIAVKNLAGLGEMAFDVLTERLCTSPEFIDLLAQVNCIPVMMELLQNELIILKFYAMRVLLKLHSTPFGLEQCLNFGCFDAIKALYETLGLSEWDSERRKVMNVIEDLFKLLVEVPELEEAVYGAYRWSLSEANRIFGVCEFVQCVASIDVLGGLRKLCDCEILPLLADKFHSSSVNDSCRYCIMDAFAKLLYCIIEHLQALDLPRESVDEEIAALFGLINAGHVLDCALQTEREETFIKGISLFENMCWFDNEALKFLVEEDVLGVMRQTLEDGSARTKECVAHLLFTAIHFKEPCIVRTMFESDIVTEALSILNDQADEDMARNLIGMAGNAMDSISDYGIEKYDNYCHLHNRRVIEITAE